LRISIDENTQAIVMKLEGRVAGPWAAEFERVWVETVPLLAKRNLILDLREVTYADAYGTRLLAEVYAHTRAKVLAGTVWTHSLAEQISRRDAQSEYQEP